MVPSAEGWHVLPCIESKLSVSVPTKHMLAEPGSHLAPQPAVFFLSAFLFFQLWFDHVTPFYKVPRFSHYRPPYAQTLRETQTKEEKKLNYSYLWLWDEVSLFWAVVAASIYSISPCERCLIRRWSEVSSRSLENLHRSFVHKLQCAPRRCLQNHQSQVFLSMRRVCQAWNLL